MQRELGVGPMSPEIIEAIFRYSHYNRTPLMIIASKNQIDHNGGYVNGWNTKQFMDFVKDLKGTYSNSNVMICRDHCGPGFNGIYDTEDTYKTIKTDIENGFDFIHIDFCKHKGARDERLDEAKKAIQYCLKLNPNIVLEIGTDENEGDQFSITNLQEVKEEVEFFTNFCKPKYYVVQTGSLVKEINQVGGFNQEFIERIREFLKSKDIKLKEHNADYFSKDQIETRNGVVDALNIAPQLGALQTMLVLQKCITYGVDFDEFIEEAYNSKKWEKWLHTNKPDNKFLCAVIAGHYNFTTDSYRKIIEQLEAREDIHEFIMDKVMEVIDHYVN
ncbi:hypothetical protein HOD83_02490 [Candidatus Woesearchaeota archaeon]|jgi:hypothetical protein|nr:hypothetical protein [Candidatus Woesearchaeota archaeon]MBT4114122.1 hypothetical protein [Candidatus Woesearchaeota archaeon]MBT4248435.1 hypothetical protein [Candidatus Woesearchaeota archaeon]